MEIKLARTAGFCFGVERAVRLTQDEMEKGSRVYTWGPIVHNEHVIREMAEKGAVVFDPEGDIDNIPEGSTVILRAHGVTKDTEEALKTRGLTVVDATCPFVKKIHRTVQDHSRAGEFIVITGDRNHPEVQGIIGWCEGDHETLDSEDDEGFKNIPKDRKICVVSQTTFQFEKFKKIVAKLEEFGYNVCYIANTICNATNERQEEAAELAAKSDVMLVVGSPTSSNSRKLYSICNERCSHTYFIQSAKDIKSNWFLDVKCVGITAGASTPKKIFEEVQNHVGEF